MKQPDESPHANEQPCPDSSETVVSATDYWVLFESVPDPYLVIDPKLRIVAVNNAYLRDTMTKREEILGCNIFEVFPDGPNDPNATGIRKLSASLNRGLANRAPDTMALQEYDIRKPKEEGGGFEESYWTPINTPALGANGEIDYIIDRVQEVTKFVNSSENVAEGESRAEMPGKLGARASRDGKRVGLITGLVFLAGMALLFLIGLLGYRSMTEVQGATSMVTHTYQVVVKLDELLTDLLAAETDQRGFIITGDLRYLDPYAAALSQVDQDIAILKSMTADNPVQQKRLGGIGAVARERLAVLQAIIETRKTMGYQAAQAVILTGRGKMLMDTIRAGIAEATTVEMALLHKRFARQERKTAKLNRRLLVGSTLAVTLFGAIFMVLMRDIFLRGLAEVGLLSHQKKLYELLEERTQANKELALQREKLEEINDRLEVEVRERINIQELLITAREYAENIVETVREPLVVLNSDLEIITANHSFYDTFKVTPEETVGNFIYDLGNRQWDIPKLRVLFDEILPHNTVFNSYEVEHDFPDIGHKTILLNARQIFRKKIGSHIILLAMEDITDRKRSHEQIHWMAHYDILTNLPNRRLLLDRLKQALSQAKRFQRSLAIMYLDLDEFKQINDTLGHDIGDELLKSVAGRLQACVRGMDTVCRQGGDEFIIVLTEITQPQDAAIVAEKIINAICEPICLQKNELHVTTSIGIAIYPVNGTDDANELMKKADIAMYEVKNTGRNGFKFYCAS